MAPNTDSPPDTPLRKEGILASLFLLSAATLAFEINLTRLFSVAQFYHFAFMIVSIALLGYGASGAALAIFHSLQRGQPARSMGRLAFATSVSILAAYLVTTWLPFDSYSLMVDRKQVFILALDYVSLAAPFFFSGMALALLLSRYPGQAGSTYAVNLVGSAVGCVIALLVPPLVGGEGMVALTSLLAAIAAGTTAQLQAKKLTLGIGVVVLVAVNTLDLGLRLANGAGLPLFAIHLSPYKSLSYALQYPGSKVTFSQWNAFSRVDMVESGSIHSLPGLSYRYLDPLPTMDGLFVDGDDLSPVIQGLADGDFTSYLPAAAAFRLRPQSSTLILEPRGGLDILSAFTLANGWVTCVELNPLVVAASPAYADERLFLNIETGRSFLQRSQQHFDVILLSLSSSFHPVQSGAYTLAEDYRYTVESFQEMLSHLNPGGVLVATRWLQDPPSEDLRLFALAVTALESSGGDPHQQLVAFRGYNTSTILARNGAFTSGELATIRSFTASRAYDLTYAPDIQAVETNRYNILPESTYYKAYLALLDTQPRQAFYDAYAYDVRPPTDDHPFFGHYFKWSQTPEIIAGFGKAWLPFGGGGYLVILALLILAILLAGVLILLPVWVAKLRRGKPGDNLTPFRGSSLVYFALLGFAFLLVEIPLLQRFILYLGNPAYAVTAVLFALLFFSGLGSRWSRGKRLYLPLGVLAILVIIIPLALPPLFNWTLGLPLPARLGISAAALAPLGFLMGIPFPSGIHWLVEGQDHQVEAEVSTSPRSDIPWIWAVNGASSVVAPILAALLALTFGFRFVLWIGAGCYLAALVTAWATLQRGAARPPGR